MTVSNSKREANDKWDKENMLTLGCRVRKDEAEIFKKYCKRQNTKPNTILKDYVNSCIEKEIEFEEKENESV